MQSREAGTSGTWRDADWRLLVESEMKPTAEFVSVPCAVGDVVATGTTTISARELRCSAHTARLNRRTLPPRGGIMVIALSEAALLRSSDGSYGPVGTDYAPKGAEIAKVRGILTRLSGPLRGRPIGQKPAVR